jgi:threonine dehydrogenase-like Zn-dependent dehydrogenase
MNVLPWQKTAVPTGSLITGSNPARLLAEKGLKPTLIIDAACHPSILQEAIGLASPAARIVLMGFSSDPCQIIQQGITGKELSIFFSPERE